MRTVAFHTLGCRLNQYETEAIASTLRKRGFKIVSEKDPAEIRIINTCTVTSGADRKSRTVISRGLKNSLVVATGCFVSNHKEELYKKGVTYVVDNDRKSHIPDILDAHFRGEIVDPDLLPEAVFDYLPAQRVFRTRTMVKIQDGCDNFCTFCIIPSVRGRAKSRKVSQIVMDARELLRRGSHELILTGVNISRYQDETTDFYSLLQQLLDIPGNFRLRLSSLEPELDIPSFLPLIRHPKFCPHLHLCLQSGSDRVLLKMRRVYTAGEYLQAIQRIKEEVPTINITTDVLVGFPGETEDDFLLTEKAVKEVGFSHIHLFSFSPRDGTRANRMTDKVPSSTVKERMQKLQLLCNQGKRHYRESLLGQKEEVLIESHKKIGSQTYSYGLGRRYVPILLPETLPLNTLHHVRLITIEDSDDPMLIARRP